MDEIVHIEDLSWRYVQNVKAPHIVAQQMALDHEPKLSRINAGALFFILDSQWMSMSPGACIEVTYKRTVAWSCFVCDNIVFIRSTDVKCAKLLGHNSASLAWIPARDLICISALQKHYAYHEFN